MIVGSAVLLLVRHGHTEANSGHPDAPLSGWNDLALSERGHREAAQLRPRLVGLSDRVAVYSSSSLRALQTAREAGPSCGAGIQVRDDLREIHCGHLDGLPVAEVKRRHPHLWACHQRRVDPACGWPGGERYDEFRRRCLAAVQDIVSRSAGTEILVFTHAGFISQVVGALRGLSPARWDRYRPGNCSITEIEVGPQGALLRRFNDCQHLLVPQPGPRFAGNCS